VDKGRASHLAAKWKPWYYSVQDGESQSEFSHQELQYKRAAKLQGKERMVIGCLIQSQMLNPMDKKGLVEVGIISVTNPDVPKTLEDIYLQLKKANIDSDEESRFRVELFVTKSKAKRARRLLIELSHRGGFVFVPIPQKHVRHHISRTLLNQICGAWYPAPTPMFETSWNAGRMEKEFDLQLQPDRSCVMAQNDPPSMGWWDYDGKRIVLCFDKAPDLWPRWELRLTKTPSGLRLEGSNPTFYWGKG
jgi:hypothetical protein